MSFSDNVTLQLDDLSAETSYLVRMVIGDEVRGTSTVDDKKVPAITVTTDCQRKRSYLSIISII